MKPPTATAAIPAAMETRAPWMIRLVMSRPSRSVPRGCANVPPACQNGGIRRDLKAILLGG